MIQETANTWICQWRSDLAGDLLVRIRVSPARNRVDTFMTVLLPGAAG